jgi:hypothetical protein
MKISLNNYSIVQPEFRPIKSILSLTLLFLTIIPVSCNLPITFQATQNQCPESDRPGQIFQAIYPPVTAEFDMHLGMAIHSLPEFGPFKNKIALQKEVQQVIDETIGWQKASDLPLWAIVGYAYSDALDDVLIALPGQNSNLKANFLSLLKERLMRHA